MTTNQLNAIKKKCEAATEDSRMLYGKRQRLFVEIASTDLPACIEEIERLRKLVKSAHREGFAAIEGFAKYDVDDDLWNLSEARKVLERP